MAVKNNTSWGTYIPWYLTVICTLSLCLIAWYLYLNIEWFKANGTSNKEMMKDGQYLIFFYTTYIGLLKRSLGIITGIAITFIGLGVSFYEMNKETKLDLKGFAKLASVSPGLIAILLGCYLIIKSIESKDTMKFADPTKTEKKK